jgi:hypothetical protein
MYNLHTSLIYFIMKKVLSFQTHELVLNDPVASNDVEELSGERPVLITCPKLHSC